MYIHQQTPSSVWVHKSSTLPVNYNAHMYGRTARGEIHKVTLSDIQRQVNKMYDRYAAKFLKEYSDKNNLNYEELAQKLKQINQHTRQQYNTIKHTALDGVVRSTQIDEDEEMLDKLGIVLSAANVLRSDPGFVIDLLACSDNIEEL